MAALRAIKWNIYIYADVLAISAEEKKANGCRCCSNAKDMPDAEYLPEPHYYIIDACRLVTALIDPTIWVPMSNVYVALRQLRVAGLGKNKVVTCNGEMYPNPG